MRLGCAIAILISYRQQRLSRKFGIASGILACEDANVELPEQSKQEVSNTEDSPWVINAHVPLQVKPAHKRQSATRICAGEGLVSQMQALVAKLIPFLWCA
jgi:hypothetical protein